MTNLFGEEYVDIPKKSRRKDKKKLAWENAFQRWCDKNGQDGTTHFGCCGFGRICDYCTDNDKGRPCVRALNAMAREKRIVVDYDDRNFENWF